MSRIGRRSTAGIGLCFFGVSAATLSLAGCNDDRASVSLPTPTGSSPSPSLIASSSEEVRVAYTDFISALDHADSMPQDSRRQQLSAYMIDPQLSRVVSHSIKNQSKGLVSYGTSIVHTKKIEVSGDTATVHDCQDSSGAGLMNARTHQKYNRGVEKESIRTSLKRGPDGQWRVSKMNILGEGC